MVAKLHVRLVLGDRLELELQRAVLQRQALEDLLPRELQVQPLAHDPVVLAEHGDDAHGRLRDAPEPGEEEEKPTMTTNAISRKGSIDEGSMAAPS